MKWVVSVLVVLFLVLQYKLWLADGGLNQWVQLKKQVAIQQKKNEKLKARNQALIDEVRALQSDNHNLEGHAREELGMVKKGETYYQVIEKKHRYRAGYENHTVSRD